MFEQPGSHFLVATLLVCTILRMRPSASTGVKNFYQKKRTCAEFSAVVSIDDEQLGDAGN